MFGCFVVGFFLCVCVAFFVCFVLLEESINVFPTSVSKHVIKASYSLQI